MKQIAKGTFFAFILTSMPAMATTIFSEDFSNGWYDNKQIQWDDNWMGTNNNNGAQANSTNQNLDSLFSYRGGTNTTSAGTIAVGQTVTIQLDYKWDLTSYTNSSGTMFGLTDNITSAGSNFMTGTANANTLGFQIQYNVYPGPTSGQPTTDGGIKMLSSFNGGNADALIQNSGNLGYAPSTTGDLLGDTMRLTYSATKTATADTWLVDMTMLNLDTSQTYTKNGVSVVNATAYNAADLYFTFTSTSTTVTTSTLDNISLTVIPEPATAVLGLIGVLGLLRRRRM